MSRKNVGPDLFVLTSVGLPGTTKYLRGGAVLPRGVFDGATIERLIAKGHIGYAPPRGGISVAEAEGSVIKKGDGAKPAAPESNQQRDLSRWAYPDEMLEGRDLDALNMLVIDHCKLYELPAVEAFDSVEVARAFLQHEL